MRCSSLARYKRTMACAFLALHKACPNAVILLLIQKCVATVVLQNAYFLLVTDQDRSLHRLPIWR